MNTCFKHPSEVRTYIFDYSAQAEVLAGETLSAPAITATLVKGTAPATLVVGTPTVSSGTIRAKLTAGSDADIYVLKCVVTTSGGHTLVGVGQLLITTKV
jgi:hypothetical protein